MTDLEAAYHVLAQAGAPLHDAEITRRTLAQSLITPTGRTPEANCMTCSTPYHRNALKRSSPTCCSEASGTQQREGKVMTQFVNM